MQLLIVYRLTGPKIMKMFIVVFTYLSILLSGSMLNAQDNDYLDSLKLELQKEFNQNKTINIVFHGHSVPSGYFKTPNINTQAAYPHQFQVYLSNKYPTAQINSIVSAKGGENSETGVKRFEEDVLRFKPDLLFIDYVLNDRIMSIEQTKEYWKEMIVRAKNRGIKVVLMTPTPDLHEDISDKNAPLWKFTNMVKELAKEQDVAVVDVYGKFLALQEAGVKLDVLMSQFNHPNELGHQVVLMAIVSALF